jgi:hypothetical protein
MKKSLFKYLGTGLGIASLSLYFNTSGNSVCLAKTKNNNERLLNVILVSRHGVISIFIGLFLI